MLRPSLLVNLERTHRKRGPPPKPRRSWHAISPSGGCAAPLVLVSTVTVAPFPRPARIRTVSRLHTASLDLRSWPRSPPPKHWMLLAPPMRRKSAELAVAWSPVRPKFDGPLEASSWELRWRGMLPDWPPVLRFDRQLRIAAPAEPQPRQPKGQEKASQTVLTSLTSRYIPFLNQSIIS